MGAAAIRAWAERIGVFTQSSLVYGGLQGFYDYGPVGTALKRSISNAWWTDVVHASEHVLGMDGTILTHPAAHESHRAQNPVAKISSPTSRYRTSIGPVDPMDQLIDAILSSASHGSDLEMINKAARDSIHGTSAFLRTNPLQSTLADVGTIVKTYGLKAPFGLAQQARVFRNVHDSDMDDKWPTWREFDIMEVDYFTAANDGDDCAIFQSYF